MINRINNYPLLALCSIIMLASSCDTNDGESESLNAPTVTTVSVTSIEETTATSGGNVSADGGAEVSAFGVCWSPSQTPTISDNHTTDGTGTGSFTSLLTGLSESSTYYVRAYATNSEGTSYGDEINFTTETAGPPVIALGETYQGGIIFYLDGTGQHGLISASSDQGVALWGCEGVNMSFTSTVLGTGQTNTTNIVNYCTVPGIAAQLCDDAVINGYDDWFLPSKDELALMHTNLRQQGLGNFAVNRYWSSSQYDAQSAWQQFFNNNVNQLFYDKDLIAYPVRAIRTF